jgi:hypothetical protein
VGGGRQMERGKEGEYRECILYFCMKIENWNCSMKEVEMAGMRENDGGSEPNEDILHVHM